MKEKLYIFRREDNGELVEVPWSDMINQVNGFITLSDGVEARRCIHLEIERDGRPKKETAHTLVDARPVISDTLGFPDHQLAEFEADRQKHGFSNVEFIRDPSEPSFMQVKCGSRDAFNQYMKHRGFHQRSGIGGVRLTQEDLDRAKELVERGCNVPQ